MGQYNVSILTTIVWSDYSPDYATPQLLNYMYSKFTLKNLCPIMKFTGVVRIVPVEIGDPLTSKMAPTARPRALLIIRRS
jgi:hypothetical protein